MDDRYLRSSATAVSVGHRREMDDGFLPMVHDKCGSSSVTNTTATEPSHQVARLAVGGAPHLASVVALLFSGGGGGGVGSFRGRGQCGLADRSLVVREM